MTQKKLNRDAILAMGRQMGSGSAKNAAQMPIQSYRPDPAKTDFKTLEQYQQIATQRQAAELFEVPEPYFVLNEGRAGATTKVDGRELINFASYDYLGLNGSPRLADAAKQAIDDYGISVSGSRSVSGERPFHRKLEKQFADLYQSEAALVFVSGHATNVSTIGELMRPGDLILHDAYSHNSIVTGAKLSGASRRTFKHNDVKDLERILKESRHRFDRVLIIIEGLYSMDGDSPDLAAFIELKKKFSAWLMVDEAHGLGVLGKTGKGIFEQQTIDPSQVDIWMGTLSKTLCGCGGYICGRQELIDILKYFAPGFIYSVGAPAPVTVAASEALSQMLDEPERVEKLQENGRFFIEQAKLAGLNTGLSEGFCVVPIVVEDSLKTVKLAHLLAEEGIFVVPITYPAVPMQEARLRFFLSSDHTKDQISKTIDVMAKSLAALNEQNFDLHSHMDKVREKLSQ